MIRTVANKPRENEGARGQAPRYQMGPMSVAQPEKGVIGQMSDMAKQRAMTGALDKGQETVMAKLATDPLAKTGTELAGTELAKIGLGGAGEEALIGNALAQGTTGAATTGAMAGLGAAVPYIGAGILAGKALGFFSEGGEVEPQYKQMGGPQTMGSRYNRNRMRMPIQNVSRPGQDLRRAFYGNRQFNPAPMSQDRRAMAIDKMRQARQDFMSRKPRDVLNPGRGGK